MTSTQTITFAWEAGEGGAPAGYNLDLDGTVITTTGPTTATTVGGGDHVWRVRAFNAVGHSDYSEAWVFAIEYGVFLPVVMRNS